MSPDKGQRRQQRKRRRPLDQLENPVRFKPHPDDAHEVVYFKRHKSDDASESVPAREFLDKVCPPKVKARIRATLAQVAAAPPNRFSGGGYWEKMHGDMADWFEVRRDGPQRHHYRVFCLLDYKAKDAEKPYLVLIDGRDKPVRTELSPSEYAAVRALGDEYLSRNPRSIDNRGQQGTKFRPDDRSS